MAGHPLSLPRSQNSHCRTQEPEPRRQEPEGPVPFPRASWSAQARGPGGAPSAGLTTTQSPFQQEPSKDEGKKAFVRVASWRDADGQNLRDSHEALERTYWKWECIVTSVILDTHTSAGGPRPSNRHPLFAVDRSQAGAAGRGHLAPRPRTQSSGWKGTCFAFPVPRHCLLALGGLRDCEPSRHSEGLAHSLSRNYSFLPSPYP